LIFSNIVNVPPHQWRQQADAVDEPWNQEIASKDYFFQQIPDYFGIRTI